MVTAYKIGEGRFVGTVYDCSLVNELNGIYLGEREREREREGKEERKGERNHSRDTIPSRTVNDGFPLC